MFSAIAQVLLKKAAMYNIKSVLWMAWIFMSVLSYGIAFVFYAITLKYFPISKISPVMTVGVMLCVVIAGVLWGEKLDIFSAVGIGLGIVSIYFIIGIQ